MGLINFHGPLFWFQLILVIILLAYLPVTALAHYGFRRQRRLYEISRILSILNIDTSFQKTLLERNPGWHLFLSVFYCSMVSLFGMVLLFWGEALGLNALLKHSYGANGSFPVKDSFLIVGMAFLGAYLWGIQHAWRRYMLNDLFPGVYYRIAMRMITAAFIALVIFNGYEALAGGSGSDGGVIGKAWPALALMIGMFPQQGLNWLTARIPLFSPKTDPSVEHLPLDMIEGVEIHDVMRLEELGIDSCYDLANIDFIPMMLKSPYCARELFDWILQAKLCVFFGPAVKDLRMHGIRTISDLINSDADFDALSKETSVTRSALDRASQSIKDDPEIERLCNAAAKLGHFWHEEPSDQLGNDCGGIGDAQKAPQ